MLLRGLCDCLGSCARSKSSGLPSHGPLLRTMLLPLLDRLSDPCPLVSDAATTALISICRHGGYPGGIAQLLAENADYTVDGVCRRLRDLKKYPRAPQLLAGVLRVGGAGLLPLMSEPLRSAIGVSLIVCCCHFCSVTPPPSLLHRHSWSVTPPPSLLERHSSTVTSGASLLHRHSCTVAPASVCCVSAGVPLLIHLFLNLVTRVLLRIIRLGFKVGVRGAGLP
jgi:hypothetical protein